MLKNEVIQELINMVKCLITYKNSDNSFVEYLTYCKTQEVLIFTTNILDETGHGVNRTINELATSSEDMIKIRDFLNSLDLGDKK